jgi:zinc finger SWIM domain-containing protein 3
LFAGKRYGHLTSNISESLNSSIESARKQPILPMLEALRQQYMKWFKERRDAGMKMRETKLVSGIETKITELVKYGRHYRILPADNQIFQVYSKGSSYTVKLNLKQCTCCKWQTTGLPCAHACIAILYNQESIQTYVEQYFTVNFYRHTYAGVI